MPPASTSLGILRVSGGLLRARRSLPRCPGASLAEVHQGPAARTSGRFVGEKDTRWHPPKKDEKPKLVEYDCGLNLFHGGYIYIRL